MENVNEAASYTNKSYKIEIVLLVGAISFILGLSVGYLVTSKLLLSASLGEGKVVDEKPVNVVTDAIQKDNTLTTEPKISTEDQYVDWNTLKTSFGFEFKYPNTFLASQYETQPGPGTTGHKFGIDLKLNDKYIGLSIGGVTQDFGAGRGGMMTDSQGYIESEGKIKCTFVNSASSDIDPKSSVMKKVNPNGVEMIVINGYEKKYEQEGDGMYFCSNPGPDHTLVLINLHNSKYRGFAIDYSKNSSDINQAQFNKLLDSIKISK